MNLSNAHFLCIIGDIYIYEIKPTTFSLFQQTSYFWRHKDSSQARGPFTNIMDALKNWEELSKVPPLPSNVIKVDFKNKKRLR